MAGVHTAKQPIPEHETILGSLKGILGATTKRPSFNLDDVNIYTQQPNQQLVNRQPSIERNIPRYRTNIGGLMENFSTKVNNGKNMVEHSVDKTIERTMNVGRNGVDDVSSGMGATLENIASIVEEVEEEAKDIIPENESSP